MLLRFRIHRFPLALVGISALLFMAGPILAQETPEATPTVPLPTPVATHEVQQTPAIVRAVGPSDAVGKGEEFEVEVRVENVQHLASFSFVLAFPQDRATFLRAEQVGAFLGTGERQMTCSDPTVIARQGETGLTLLCATANPPFCLGGPSGPSGSGLLVRATFRAADEGDIKFNFLDSTLILDDLQPCDVDAAQATEIPHRNVGVTVRVQSGGASWVPMAAIVAGAVALLAAAGGGLARILLRRQRGV